MDASAGILAQVASTELIIMHEEQNPPGCDFDSLSIDYSIIYIVRDLGMSGIAAEVVTQVVPTETQNGCFGYIT